MTKKFDTKYLIEELELPYNTVNKTLLHSGKWTLLYEIVFQDKDGKYWQTQYYTDITEMQHECPWVGQEQVECTEVEKHEVTVMRWVPVK